MTLRNLAKATTALAFFGLANAAAAQNTEVDAVVVTAGSQVDLPGVYAGGQVASGARIGLLGALDVMDTPFAITSYTGALARAQQARSIADIVQNDPTVRVAKGFGNFQDVYIVRGFPIYSDDMTYNGVFGVLPRQFLAAEFVERVDVLRGASAFLNGAAPGGSGVGGALNVAPKRASDRLARVTAGVETGGIWNAAADLANRFGANDEFGVRANVLRRDGETSVDNQKRELTGASLGVDYRGEQLRFSADAGYQDHRITAPRPSVTPLAGIPDPPKGSTNYALPWTYTDEKQLFGAVRGEFDVTDNISFWAAAGGRRGDEDNVLANPNSLVNGVLSAYRFDNVRKDRVVSADTGVRFDFDTGSVGHRLIVSASALESRSRNAYAFSDFAGFAGDLYTPIVTPPPAATFFVGGDMSDPLPTERVRNSSFAIADMMSLFDGAVLATIGARQQNIATASYDYNTGVRGSRYSADALTPVLALVIKPRDGFSIYANYAEALQPGQAAPAVSGGVTIVNAGEVLDPFRSKQYEVGLKYDAGTFGGSVSLFSVNQPTAIVEGNRFTAGGEQRHQGVELSVYGEPVEGFRILGGATFLDPEIHKTADGVLDGNRALGVAERQVNVNLEWDVPSLPGLTIDGRVSHTGPQYADLANTVELEAWTRLDLGVRYGFEAAGKNITLRARVENLTGKDYWASVGGYPGANYLVLANPRTVSLSASVEF